MLFVHIEKMALTLTLPLYLSLMFGFWPQFVYSESFPGVGRWEAISFPTLDGGCIGTGHADGTTYLNDIWCWNSTSGEWRNVSFPGVGRRGAISFPTSDGGCVGIGYNGTYLNDIWCWNAESGVWDNGMLGISFD